MKKDVDPEAQLEFMRDQIRHYREQTLDPMNRTRIGVTERRYERALDAFESILSRRRGDLDGDEDGRDVLYALGFEVDDRCNECGRKDCPDYLNKSLEEE